MLSEQMCPSHAEGPHCTTIAVWHYHYHGLVVVPSKFLSQIFITWVSAMTCGTSCAGVQQDCLHRVLRAAVNYHCLAVAPGAWGRAAHFQNNALSSLLLKDHPTHMSSFVRALQLCLACAMAIILLQAPQRPQHLGFSAHACSKGLLLVSYACMRACRLVPHLHIAGCRAAVHNLKKFSAGASRRG
jgi:hypothetical protein